MLSGHSGFCCPPNSAAKIWGRPFLFQQVSCKIYTAQVVWQWLDNCHTTCAWTGTWGFKSSYKYLVKSLVLDGWTVMAFQLSWTSRTQFMRPLSNICGKSSETPPTHTHRLSSQQMFDGHHINVCIKSLRL